MRSATHNVSASAPMLTINTASSSLGAEASRVKAPSSFVQTKPRRNGVPTGASMLRSMCGGDDPHVAMVLQRRRPQRVLAITVQCKTNERKGKPREGTAARGDVQGQ